MELKTQIAEYLQEATKEAVSILLGIEIKVVGAGPLEVGEEDVISSINFAGTMAGKIAVVLSGRGACWVASKILTTEITEVNPAVTDKAGELLNMILGCLKTRLRGAGHDLLFQGPAIVKAQDLTGGGFEKAETIHLAVAIDQVKCGIIFMYKIPESDQPPKNDSPESRVDAGASAPGFSITEEKVAPAVDSAVAKKIDSIVSHGQVAPDRASLDDKVLAASDTAVAGGPDAAPPAPQEKLAEGAIVSITSESSERKERAALDRDREPLANGAPQERPLVPETPSGDTPKVVANEKSVVPGAIPSPVGEPAITVEPKEQKPAARDSAALLQAVMGNDPGKASEPEIKTEVCQDAGDFFPESMRRLEALLASLKQQK
jgi:CheY-specific phosphatase CheX